MNWLPTSSLSRCSRKSAQKCGRGVSFKVATHYFTAILCRILDLNHFPSSKLVRFLSIRIHQMHIQLKRINFCRAFHFSAKRIYFTIISKPFRLQYVTQFSKVLFREPIGSTTTLINNTYMRKVLKI